MTIDTFIDHLREQYELLEDDVVLTPVTEYKQLDDWDSLVALSLIAMVDSEYGVTIDGDDIRSTETVQELYTLVEAKHA